ncbi:hypothetical protein [Sphaerisporangium perillae]|uniref:hypothetical protein n=1 Tax=Sphaerisporangium perillae TaxID=2935860 RepID=UPI00200F30E1|nr:hypothetical protein [Sphaerisporangium perillae]
MVRVTAEWAVWGRRPGTRDGDEILAFSQGRFSRDDYGEIIARYATGAPVNLPQVTMSWVGGGASAHIGLAVQSWSGKRDGLGRDIAVIRYFCVPYAQLAGGPVSYEALYHALDGRTLPFDGPLTVEVPSLDAEPVAAAVDGTARSAAALLLTGAPVCVVNAEAVPLLNRLRFLDAVASLLPYGFRSRLTASTWTDSASRHRIRLSFARHAPQGAHSISWGETAPISKYPDIAQHYHETLVNCRDLTGLVRRFARETEPQSMRTADLSHIPGLAGAAPAARPPSAATASQMAATQPAEDVEEPASTLTSLSSKELIKVAVRKPMDPEAVRTMCSELAKRGDDPANRAAISEALRRRGRLVTAIHQLHPADPDGQVRRFHALLTAAYGPMLDRPALEKDFLSESGPPSVSLLTALTMMCTPDARVALVESVFMDLLGQAGLTRDTLDQVRADRFDSHRRFILDRRHWSM